MLNLKKYIPVMEAELGAHRPCSVWLGRVFPPRRLVRVLAGWWWRRPYEFRLDEAAHRS
jgi:hypothetical protein